MSKTISKIVGILSKWSLRHLGLKVFVFVKSIGEDTRCKDGQLNTSTMIFIAAENWWGLVMNTYIYRYSIIGLGSFLTVSIKQLVKSWLKKWDFFLPLKYAWKTKGSLLYLEEQVNYWKRYKLMIWFWRIEPSYLLSRVQQKSLPHLNCHPIGSCKLRQIAMVVPSFKCLNTIKCQIQSVKIITWTSKHHVFSNITFFKIGESVIVTQNFSWTVQVT